MTSSSLEAAVEKVLPEIVARMDELKASQDREIGELRRTLDTWGGITHQLAKLLEAKTQAAEGVSSSYASLAEHLMKFVVHLNASEGIMRAVEARLQQSLSTENNASGSTSDLELLGEVQASNNQLRAILQKIVPSVQTLAQASNPGNSIWTEYFAWRPAFVWFSIGGATIAVFLWVTFRVTGFNVAAQSIISVDTRLRNIEELIQMEVNYGDPAFEERPME